MLISEIDKRMHSYMKIRQPRLLGRIKGGRYTQNQRKVSNMFCFVRKRASLVNKDQHMLRKLSLNANSIAILANIRIGVYKYTFIWQANFARL